MAGSKQLVEWLEKIGTETHEDVSIDDDGNIITRTKDEELARLIWKQALGYTREILDENGSVIKRDFVKPDPKMQQFIIERREGKCPAVEGDGGMTATDKILGQTKESLNDMAEQAVHGDRPEQIDPE